MKNIQPVRTMITALTAAIIFAINAAVASGASSLHVDAAFNAPAFATPNPAFQVLLVAGGKFVRYWNVDTLVDVPDAGGITRYLPDGTLDASFRFPSDVYAYVFAAAPLADARLIVAAVSCAYACSSSNNPNGFAVLRLNADGSIDPSFTVTRPSGVGGIRVMALQPDGKILVSGTFTGFNGTPRQGIVRLNSDGSLDTGFAIIALTGEPFGGGPSVGVWAQPVVQSDGKIVIGGDFDSVSDGINTIFVPGVVRLNSNGTIDTSFQPSGFERTRFRPVRGIGIQSNGRIVIGGIFTVTFPPHPTYNRLPLIRLDAQGNADPTFASYTMPQFAQIRDLVVQPDDKIIGVDFSAYRLNATDGTLDSTFRQPELLVDRQPGGEAFSIRLQSDGRVLIGGLFTDVDDAIGPCPEVATVCGPPNGDRFGVARLNSDGTLDALTTPHKTAVRTAPNAFAYGSDGKTLITFNSGFGPTIPHDLGRLLADGSLDTGFDPFPSFEPGGSLTPLFSARGLLRLPDGKIFVFGNAPDEFDPTFTLFTYGRLFTDGTEDASYSADWTVRFSPFSDAVAQSDGKVLITSDDPERTISGEQLRRLDANGSLDAGFKLDALVAAEMVPRDRKTGIVKTMSVGMRILAVLSNGRTLISYLAADKTYKIVRLNDDGSLDRSFLKGAVAAPGTTISPLFVLDPQHPDSDPPTILENRAASRAIADAKEIDGGALIVVGSFDSYNGVSASGIVGLMPHGTVMPRAKFNAGAGAQWTQTSVTDTLRPGIENLQLRSNGQLLVVGTFEAFNGVPAPGITSLLPNGAVDPSFVAPVVRSKYNSPPTYLEKQADGSYLLSGPYRRVGQTQTPSFIRLIDQPAP